MRYACASLKSGIATRNPAFNRMIERIETVATRSKAPMLLMGPTGAGKSQLARRVFELKKLKHQLPGRFVEVNCATLRGDGAMSALFGHIHQRVAFDREARTRFLAFATSPEARWAGNFRDLGAAVMRMATLANAGRIQIELVEEEIARLRGLWREGGAPSPLDALLGEGVAGLDRYPGDKPCRRLPCDFRRRACCDIIPASASRAPTS